MQHKKISIILASTLALAACNKPKITCSDESSKSIIAKIINESAEKEVLEIENGDGVVFESSKVRATLKQITSSMDSIRTSKEDPNSSKVFCEAQFKITVPTELLKEAEAGRNLMGQQPLANFARSSGFEQNANTFTHSIGYSVQPTDDGKEVFGEVENSKPVYGMLSEITVSALAKPMMEARKAEQLKQEQEQQAEQARLQAEQEQAERLQQQEMAKNEAEQAQAAHAKATADNKLANQMIGEVWKSISDETRKSLLESQRAWIKKKTIDCKIEAANRYSNEIQKEIFRLECDSHLTKQRASELRQYI